MASQTRKIQKKVKSIKKKSEYPTFEYFLAIGITKNKVIFNLEEVPFDEVENMYDSVNNRIMQDGYLWIDNQSPERLIYMKLTQEDGEGLMRVGYSLTDYSNVFQRYMMNGGLPKGSFVVNFAESDTPAIFKESTFG